MINWVDDRLAEWGNWSRGSCDRLGYPTQTPIYKLMKLGAIGAASHAEQSNVIIMPIDVEEVETLVVKLSAHQQDLIRTKYIDTGTDSQKAQDLGVSRDCFMRELDWLHQVLSMQLHKH